MTRSVEPNAHFGLSHKKIITLAVVAALTEFAVTTPVIAAETLAEVTVKEAKSPFGLIDGYVANSSQTATKTDTPIIETPQSISVVTQQQMLEQGAYTLQDALNYTTGVTAGAYGLDNRGDWFFVRGITPLQLYDGLRTHIQTYDIPRPDPFFLERVEVLRGPGSVIFGQGAVGGVVNVVSKRPQAETSRQINLQYGMYDRKQIGVDLTGKVDEAGTLLYRFVGLAKDTGTQVDYTDNQRYQIAPSLTWKPTNQTTLNVQLNLQKGETDGATAAFPPHSGTVTPNPNGKIPTSRFTGEPGIDKTHVDYQALNWQLEHAFSDAFSFRQNGRYSAIDYDYITLYPNIFAGVPGSTAFFTNPQLSEVTRFGYANKAQTKTFALDNNVQFKSGLGVTKHTFLAGVDYFRTKIDERNGFSFISTPFNLFNPVYGNFNPAELPVATDQPDNTTDQIGFYVQDQVKLGPLVVTLGLRRDESNKKTQGVAGEQTDRETTARVGAVYLFENGFAPYASYTESFNPVIGNNFFGVAFKPQIGKQNEVGLRYQPLNSNSLYTVSLFDLALKNALTVDPSNVNNQVQRGTRNSRGIEFEALTNIADKVDLIANYAYTRARDDDGTSARDRRVAEVHDHTASVWATYAFSVANVPGFKVGAGVRYIGSNKDESSTLALPSVTLLDAMIAYENKDWRFALNGTNLTDKTYIATVLSRGDSWYANRMNIVGSLTYKF